MNDARTEAEAAFKKVTAKVVVAPPKRNRRPRRQEQVTLRLDQDVLEYFQEGGPGCRTGSTTPCARPPENSGCGQVHCNGSTALSPL